VRGEGFQVRGRSGTARRIESCDRQQNRRHDVAVVTVVNAHRPLLKVRRATFAFFDVPSMKRAGRVEKTDRQLRMYAQIFSSARKKFEKLSGVMQESGFKSNLLPG
jgi:hypothetical protein